jgi:hypothetical protein
MIGLLGRGFAQAMGTRPESPPIRQTGSSFPYGHAAAKARFLKGLLTPR